jgi:hypothetical protein
MLSSIIIRWYILSSIIIRWCSFHGSRCHQGFAHWPGQKWPLLPVRGHPPACDYCVLVSDYFRILPSSTDWTAIVYLIWFCLINTSQSFLETFSDVLSVDSPTSVLLWHTWPHCEQLWMSQSYDQSVILVIIYTLKRYLQLIMLMLMVLLGERASRSTVKLPSCTVIPWEASPVPMTGYCTAACTSKTF